MGVLKRIRRRFAAVGIVLAVSAGAPLAVSASASASPWDPHVALTGSASCGILWGHVTGLWLWTAQDGGQWFGFSGTHYSESFRRDFWHVPSGGTTVHYTLYCAGLQQSKTFGLARPTFGTYTTRNIYWSA